MLAGKLREVPDRQRRGVAARLIGIFGELADGVLDILIAGKIKFVMVRGVALSHPLKIAAFVKTTTLKGNRKSLELLVGLRCSIVNNGAGIHATTEPNHPAGHPR